MSQAIVLHEENQDEKVIDLELKGNSESPCFQLSRLKLQVSRSAADTYGDRLPVIVLPQIMNLESWLLLNSLRYAIPTQPLKGNIIENKSIPSSRNHLHKGSWEKKHFYCWKSIKSYYDAHCRWFAKRLQNGKKSTF